MKSENFEQVKKLNGSKSSKLLYIFLILALLLVLAVSVMAANSKPKAIFQKQIDKMLTYEETANYDTMKIDMDLDMNVSGGEETNEIANLINDAKLSFNMETDNNTQEELYTIKLTKAEDELINAQAKLDAESEKVYVNLGELFNKTIEMNISEILEDSSEMNVTESLNFMQLLSAKKAESILKKEAKAQLKTEYFSSEKVTVDGENLTKNVLKMTGKELKDMIKTVCQNLSGNDEFINCFEDGDEVRDALKEISDEVEDTEISDDTYFEVDLYTNGILPKIKRVDFVITQDDEKISLQLTQVTEEEYEYQFLANDEKIAEGTAKVQMSNDNFEIEVTAKVGETTVTVKTSANVVYNEELSDFDTSDAVKAEELTMEDIMVLYGNFMQSKLCEVVEQFTNYGSVNELPEDDFEYDFEDYEF